MVGGGVQNHFWGKTCSFPFSLLIVEGNISVDCAISLQRVHAINKKTTGITFCLSVKGDLVVLAWEMQPNG